MMDFSNFSFFSYNTRGTNDNIKCTIDELIGDKGENASIVCIQEHFQLKKNLRKITNNFTNMSVIGKGAHKDVDQIDNARPKGGLAVLVPKNLRSECKSLVCISWRIQAVTMVINNSLVLLLNVYLPWDRQANGISDDNKELIETLIEVESIMNNNKYDILVVAGDFNTEVTRKTSHVNIVKEFWEKNNLYSVCDKVDFSHGEVTLDHILMLNHHKHLVYDNDAVHSVNNSSDHEPIYATIKFPEKSNDATDDDNTDAEDVFEDPKTRYLWENATDDQKLAYKLT